MFDKGDISRSFSTAASDYDRLAGLQRRVGDSLIAKFPPVVSADRVLDLGSGTGYMLRRLMQSRAVRECVALDIAPGMLQVSRQLNRGHPIAYVCADIESLPLIDDAVGQIYSNLALQWVQGLEQALRECRRVLSPGGRLVFSTFGSQTLRELKVAWMAVDEFEHVNRFVSEEALLDCLQAADFGMSTIRRQIHCRSYPSVMALMKELKGLGAHNVNHGRKRIPTTKRQMQTMIEHYPANADGSILATYDVLLVEALT